MFNINNALSVVVKRIVPICFLGVAYAEKAPIDVFQSYDIPIVDLQNKESFHTIVDKQKGQYLGHPTTVLLDDKKTIICVYPKGHGRGPVVMKKSFDGGKTWSERLPVPESWATSKEVPTLYDVYDANGKKRIIMFSGIQGTSQTVMNRMAISEDEGKTWSELEPVETLPGGIVVMSDLIGLNTGKGHYMATYHISMPGNDEKGKFGTLVPLVTFTKDGGLTWTKPEPVGEPIRDMHLCEGGFVRSPDGKTIAMLLRENSRNHNSQVIYSTDEGKTWSKPSNLPASLNGDRHQALYLPDGRLFIQFRDIVPKKNAEIKTSPTVGDWVAWVGRWEDIVDGKQGEYRIRMRDNRQSWDTAYPAAELLPDGTLVCTSYGHFDRKESPYIRSLRFKITDTDAMAKEIKSGKKEVIVNDLGDKESVFDPNNPEQIQKAIEK